VSSRVGHRDGLVFTSGQVFGQLVFCAIFVFFCENNVHGVRTIYKQNLFDKINEIRYSTECP